MLAQTDFEGTPMYEALKELAQEMEKRQMPPATLNVIGGFALMIRGYREVTDITDIDYVGISLYEELNDLSHAVGLKHGMESGWINNDGMLVGDSIESFELSTGELHFEEALHVGRITINVLEEKDLLRLKIISADTAMTEMDATGEYARTKDFADIKALMDAEHLMPEDIEREFGEFILCKSDTLALVQDIYENGPDAAAKRIEEKSKEMRESRTSFTTRSPYVESILDQLLTAYKNVELSDEELSFDKQEKRSFDKFQL